MLAHFFERYPEILDNCIAISEKINLDIGYDLVYKNEISFDLIVPFLLPNFELPLAKEISYYLRIHREIVDYYNNNNPDVVLLINLLPENQKLFVVSFEEYQIINNLNRVYCNNISNSYLESTQRVYYRFLVLEDLLNDEYKNNIKRFSAFLLFDDDVFDLEADIKNKKDTILLQYLNQGNSIKAAIAEMVSTVGNSPGLFNEYVKMFKIVYEHE